MVQYEELEEWTDNIGKHRDSKALKIFIADLFTNTAQEDQEIFLDLLQDPETQAKAKDNCKLKPPNTPPQKIPTNSTRSYSGTYEAHEEWTDNIEEDRDPKDLKNFIGRLFTQTPQGDQETETQTKEDCRLKLTNTPSQKSPTNSTHSSSGTRGRSTSTISGRTLSSVLEEETQEEEEEASPAP